MHSQAPTLHKQYICNEIGEVICLLSALPCSHYFALCLSHGAWDDCVTVSCSHAKAKTPWPLQNLVIITNTSPWPILFRGVLQWCWTLMGWCTTKLMKIGCLQAVLSIVRLFFFSAAGIWRIKEFSEGSDFWLWLIVGGGVLTLRPRQSTGLLFYCEGFSPLFNFPENINIIIIYIIETYPDTWS